MRPGQSLTCRIYISEDISGDKICGECHEAECSVLNININTYLGVNTGPLCDSAQPQGQAGGGKGRDRGSFFCELLQRILFTF